MGLMKTVIFDLDGTLAIIDKRRAKAALPNGKMNWTEFFAPENIQLDEPNLPVIESFKAMQAAGFTVGIFSGRDDISRQETMDWLDKHGIDPMFLRMRKHGSFVPDDKLKKIWLDELVENGNEIMCTFDDRDKVVKMWRENGVACFQVAPGDF
jgi:phosphoglycolate phosphatase-like HAD superfamily hydrolase